MYGKILGDDDLMAELEALTGDLNTDQIEAIPNAPTGKIDVAAEIPNAPTGAIEAADANDEEFESRMKKLEAA